MVHTRTPPGQRDRGPGGMFLRHGGDVQGRRPISGLKRPMVVECTDPKTVMRPTGWMWASKCPHAWWGTLEVEVAHSSPQETLCTCYATETMELELAELHKACILEEAAQAVNDDTG